MKIIPQPGILVIRQRTVEQLGKLFIPEEARGKEYYVAAVNPQDTDFSVGDIIIPRIKEGVLAKLDGTENVFIDKQHILAKITNEDA